jgi:hypothetical protein
VKAWSDKGVTRKQKLKNKAKYFRQQYTKKCSFYNRLCSGQLRRLNNLRHSGTKSPIKCILKSYFSKQRIEANFDINRLIISYLGLLRPFLPKNIYLLPQKI